MFTSFSSVNYYPHEALLVWYEQAVVASSASGYLVRITRHATKSYAWLDMTQAAAASCAAAMSSKYTRSFAAWSYTASDQSFTIEQTSVTERKTDISNAQNPAGGRDVSVSVNETDRKYVLSQTETIAYPSYYFQTENQRDYDDTVASKTTEGISVYLDNKSVSRELDVRYSVAKTTLGWLYTRYATKIYTFVGMTQQTAENCVAMKLAQYVRDCRFVNSSATNVADANKSEKRLCANLKTSYNGHTWSVSIAVNETDVRISATNQSPATVFSLENQRDYDQSPKLYLTSVTRRENNPAIADIVYVNNIPDFSAANLVFQYATPGSATAWTVATITDNAVTIPTHAVMCRLYYNSLVSNTLTV